MPDVPQFCFAYNHWLKAKLSDMKLVAYTVSGILIKVTPFLSHALGELHVFP